jgi:uncharacterized protein YdaU (DUF1376 family)
MLEDGAYGRLLRKYYATELPLPAAIKDVQRLVLCRSEAEKKAVERVLREFFDLQADGWHQERCDKEIAKFHERKANQKAISMMGVEARRSVNRRSTNVSTDGQPSVNGRLTPPDSNLQSPPPIHQTPTHPLPPQGGPERVGVTMEKLRGKLQERWTPPTEEQIRAGK